jgi:hypothetical protein
VSAMPMACTLLCADRTLRLKWPTVSYIFRTDDYRGDVRSDWLGVAAEFDGYLRSERSFPPLAFNPAPIFLDPQAQRSA